MRGGEFRLLAVDRHLVAVIRTPRSKWYRIKCFCPPSRKRKDGTCKHEWFIFDTLKPEIKARTHIEALRGD